MSSNITTTTKITNEPVAEIKETSNFESVDSVILELEKKGYEKAIQVLPSVKLQDVGDVLMNFMKEGSEDFKKRTGRNMTYSEIRAAWG